MSNDRIAESFLQQWNANNKGIKVDQFGILDVDSVEKYGQGSLFGDGQYSDRENQKKMFTQRVESECGANTHESGKGFGKGNTCATGGKATTKPSAKSRQEMVDSGKNDDYFRMGGKDLKSAAEGGDDEAKAELNRRAQKKGRDLPYPEETPAEGETKNVSFTYNGKTINAEVSIGPNGGLIKLTDENFEEISTRGVTNEEAGNYLLQVRNRMSDYQEHEPDEYMIAGDDDPEADEELPEQRPWEGDDVTGGEDYVSGSDLVDTNGFKSAQGDELIAELWSEGETSEIHLYHSVDGKKTSVHSEYQMDPKEAAAQFDRIAKGDGAGMLKDLEAGQDDDAPVEEAPVEEAPAEEAPAEEAEATGENVTKTFDFSPVGLGPNAAEEFHSHLVEAGLWVVPDFEANRFNITGPEDKIQEAVSGLYGRSAFEIDLPEDSDYESTANDVRGLTEGTLSDEALIDQTKVTKDGKELYIERHEDRDDYMVQQQPGRTYYAKDFEDAKANYLKKLGLDPEAPAPEEKPGATQEEAPEGNLDDNAITREKLLEDFNDLSNADIANMTAEQLAELDTTIGDKSMSIQRLERDRRGEKQEYYAIDHGGRFEGKGRAFAYDPESAKQRWNEIANQQADSQETADRINRGRDRLLERRAQQEPAQTLSYDELMETTDPREVLNEYKREDDPDYAYARKSSVGNFGADVGDSARHKRNMYADLDSVVNGADADKLMTAKKILPFYPNNISDVAEHDPLGAIEAMLALRAFPGQLKEDKRGYHKFPSDSPSDSSVMAIKYPGKKIKQNSKQEQQKAYFQAVVDFQKFIDKTAAESSSYHDMGIADQAANWMREAAVKARAAGNGVLYSVLADRNNINKVRNSMRFSSSSFGLSKVGKLFEGAGLLEPGMGYRDVSNSREAYEKMKDVAYSLSEGKSVNAAFGQSKSRGPREGAGTADRSHRYTDHAQRTGGPEATHGGDFQKAMTYLENEVKFRGLQWGNSVTDKERKHHATMLSDAMLDLADVTGMPLDQMSFGGKLAMAVGARGRGTAMAHYEPGYNTINLTRKNGIGSLAHEWGHAMDYLAGGGSPLTEGGTPYEGGGSVKAAIDKFNKACETSGFLDAVKNSESHKMNRKKGGDKANYWTEPKEMFARSFESWVAEKLNSSGRANTYLTAGANVPTETSSGEYPTKAHMEVLSPIFEEVMDAYRKTKLQQDKPIKYSAEERHFLQERFLNLWSSI